MAWSVSVYETPAEIAALQDLLDASLVRSSEHLRAIVTPPRTLSAPQAVQVLDGMCTLSLATVTAQGEPRISGVDGHLVHGRWTFTTDGRAVKARHLRARPSASASHLRGDDLGVFVHGRVEFLAHEHPDWHELEEHLVRHYGSSPSSWSDDIVYLRLDPAWMVVYAADPDALLATAG